jgi:FKBP-type peptidyl-prolyl cis-trans isomerase
MMRKAFVTAVLLMTAMWMTAQKAPEHPSSVDGPGVSLPSGLVYWDLKVGMGEKASKGHKVKVHYTGWLLEEGTKFDSSLDRNAPFEFDLGAGHVIKGWDEGVSGMKVGGKRQLRIPPDLGYGYRGSPPVIPRNAYLIFDVELLDVK